MNRVRQSQRRQTPFRSDRDIRLIQRCSFTRVEAEGLTELARDVIREEIERRGLETLIDNVELGEQQVTGSTFVEVWTGATIKEAAIVLHLTEIANIQAHLVPLQGRETSRRF